MSACSIQIENMFVNARRSQEHTAKPKTREATTKETAFGRKDQDQSYELTQLVLNYI